MNKKLIEITDEISQDEFLNRLKCYNIEYHTLFKSDGSIVITIFDSDYEKLREKLFSSDVNQTEDNIFELESHLSVLKKAVEVLKKIERYDVFAKTNMDYSIEKLQSKINEIKANAYDRMIRTH